VEASTFDDPFFKIWDVSFVKRAGQESRAGGGPASYSELFRNLWPLIAFVVEEHISHLGKGHLFVAGIEEVHSDRAEVGQS